MVTHSFNLGVGLPRHDASKGRRRTRSANEGVREVDALAQRDSLVELDPNLLLFFYRCIYRGGRAEFRENIGRRQG